MFFYYYGRAATTLEKSHWSQKTSQQLSNALTPHAAQFTNAGYYKDVLAKPKPAPVAPTPTPTPTPTPSPTGWVDPATGKPSPAGMGIPDSKSTPSGPSGPSGTITPEGGGTAPGKQFYRKGIDIYEAGTNRHIGPTEWNRDWDGKATEVAAPGTTGETAPPSPVLAPVKSVFKDTAAYKRLSPDLQALVDTAFSFFRGTPDEQEIFATSLIQAQAMADPYSKAQLALAIGEFQSRIAFAQGDFTRASEIITRTRDQIAEDVTAQKGNLTLEQQAEIARQVRDYDEDLLSIADQAAEKGLTFATGARSRALAEERRSTQYQDVVQSSQRRYNFQIKELELKAARGDTDAQKQLADIKAKSEFQLQDIGRSAEQVLGTTTLPKLTTGTPEYIPVGGVLGDIEQKRRQAIIESASLGLP